ncbi:MAG: MerC family mercury resistance protein [Pseudomonadota bacterium]
MPTIELIYDRDCPNVPQARTNLLRALGQVGVVPRWQEWDRADTRAPERIRAYGSPTVLVNGKDVVESDTTDAACCRIYASGDGNHQGAPPVAAIMAALRQTSKTPRFGSGLMPLVPAIGTALMPKLVCPACWPAYAGLLSALGLGFIDYTPLLLPLTLVFLAVVLVMLAWRAEARRGYAPLALGMVATVIVLIGKFQFDSDIATYTGIALLVGASLWNTWPRRNPTTLCPACVTGGEPEPSDNLKGGVS